MKKDVPIRISLGRKIISETIETMSISPNRSTKKVILKGNTALLFNEIDGIKNIEEISKKIKLSVSETWRILTLLEDNNLISFRSKTLEVWK